MNMQQLRYLLSFLLVYLLYTSCSAKVNKKVPAIAVEHLEADSSRNSMDSLKKVVEIHINTSKKSNLKFKPS